MAEWCAPSIEIKACRRESAVEASRWEDKWSVIEHLGQGGQGAARRVSLISDPVVIGVLKTLVEKRKKDLHSRGRMAREVASLRTLAPENLKVPRVLDDNVSRFEDLAAQLYFVMEFAKGETLKRLVPEGGLPLLASIDLALDLCATVGAAHRLGVVHRDLKPSNVVVRGLDPADAVLLDFGLSFQAEGDPIVETHAHSRIENEFLTVPETTWHGGSNRDPRIDVTALVAIFYYCLTKRNPIVLRDEYDRPPHRRPNGGIDHVTVDEGVRQRLNALLDRGFQGKIDDRFQTFAEVTQRLRMLVDSFNSGLADPAAKSAELAKLLIRRDRKSQLGAFVAPCNSFAALLHKAFNAHGSRFHKAFSLTVTSRSHSDDHPLPAGFDLVSEVFEVTVEHVAAQVRCHAYYTFASQGSEVVTMRFFRLASKRGHTATQKEWEAVHFVDPLSANAHSEVNVALEQVSATDLEVLLDEVTNLILEGGNAH